MFCADVSSFVWDCDPGAALLAPPQPLQSSKPKQQQIVKTAPDPTKARPAAMPPPPAAAQLVPYAIGQKGRQPTGPPPKVPPVKNLPTALPPQLITTKQQESTSAPQPDKLPATRIELIILALSENWDLNKYPIFAQNWACVGASCLDHLFLPIFP